jgi:Flp pilus assembly pilin Flp
MKNIVMRLWENEEGQDLMEYGLLLVLIVLAAAALINPLGASIGGLFTKANTCANAPSPGNCGGAGT